MLLVDVIALLEAMIGRRLDGRYTPPREGDVPHVRDGWLRARFTGGLLRTVEWLRSVARRA
jgi:hypothetical protein